MHTETKHTAITAGVKAAVAARDCLHGPATCIICGAPGAPNAHVIRRSKGGMGVEQNIVSLCGLCHRAFDEGERLDRLEPLGFCSRKDIQKYIYAYMEGFYPGWTPESVIYHKQEGSQC